MSVTLNHSDFQCLQDQLVELKTKNYELAEKNRRYQADFDAAKAKICALQLKLEEQERDFALTSTTLRREIETVASGNRELNKEGKDEDYKAKYKKLLHKAKELQQRYEKSIEGAQQLVLQNKNSSIKLAKLEEDNSKLLSERDSKCQQLELIEKEYQEKFEKAIDEYKSVEQSELQKQISSAKELTEERDSLKTEVERLSTELNNLNTRIAAQVEERKITERKGLQIVKELKRQLASEKSKTDTLQQRLENLLKNPIAIPCSTELEPSAQLSNSSSTNGNSSSNETGNKANQDSNSVGSWNLVGIETKKSKGIAPNETLSLYSVDSEECETVQQPCDTKSEDLSHMSSNNKNDPNQLADDVSRQSLNTATSLESQIDPLSLQARVKVLKKNLDGCPYSPNLDVQETVTLEDQAALVERLARLQHEKWILEEKLSYLEQANSVLSEDLANRSDIIRNYFMEQASRTTQLNHCENPPISPSDSGTNASNIVNRSNSSSKRASITENVQHVLSDKPSFKKMVDFLKERSLAPSNESEAISREAMRKMQLMLEETLIKCNKLQENLDFVTSDKSKS